MNVSSVAIEYLRIEPETVLEVSDKVLIAIQQYGLPYIEFDSTLTTGCQRLSGRTRDVLLARQPKWIPRRLTFHVTGVEEAASRVSTVAKASTDPCLLPAEG